MACSFIYHDIQTHLIIGQRDIKQMDYKENMRLQLCLNNCTLFFYNKKLDRLE